MWLYVRVNRLEISPRIIILLNHQNRTSTTTWMQNLIKGIWMSWPNLTDERRSASNIVNLIKNEICSTELARSFSPEERTVQRVCARFRDLIDPKIPSQSDSSDITKYLSFGDGWPTDSDDIAYLLALLDSWGPRYRPNKWSSNQIIYFDSQPKEVSICDRRDNWWDSYKPQPRFMWEVNSIDKTDQNIPSSLLPLTPLEIGIALKLKSTFGWPDKFSGSGETSRIAWRLYHPISPQALPGELAIIKEMALRQKHSETTEYSIDHSDIMTLLMDTPWETPNVDSRANWLYGDRLSGVIWPPDQLDSILVSESQRFTVNKLKLSVESYIQSGDSSELEIAQDLIADIKPPQVIADNIKQQSFAKSGLIKYTFGYLQQIADIASVYLTASYAHFEAAHCITSDRETKVNQRITDLFTRGAEVYSTEQQKEPDRFIRSTLLSDEPDHIKRPALELLFSKYYDIIVRHINNAMGFSVGERLIISAPIAVRVFAFAVENISSSDPNLRPWLLHNARPAQGYFVKEPIDLRL